VGPNFPDDAYDAIADALVEAADRISQEPGVSAVAPAVDEEDQGEQASA
jgi:hypothetical protein